MGQRWLRAVGGDEGDGGEVRASDGWLGDGWGGPPGGVGGEGGGGDRCLCDDCLSGIVGYPLAEQYGGGGGFGDDRGMITEVVLLDGHLIDVRKGPVGGSGYECAAHELQARGVLRREPPRTVVVREEPEQAMLDWLARVVGGEAALAALDDEPLPVEDLDLGAVPGWARERARLVDEHVQGAFGHQLIGPELLTACRRLLVRAAGAGAFEAWHGALPEQVAAAVVHCAAKASALGAPTLGHPMRSILRGIGVSGYPSDRSRRLATLVGGSGWPHGRRPMEVPDVYVLGDPALLLSCFRSDLVVYRDRAVRLAAGSGASGAR